MAELSPVVPGEPVDASTFGNPVVDRVLSRYADETARDAAVPLPQPGDFAYIENINEVQVYSGTAWLTGGHLALTGGSMSGDILMGNNDIEDIQNIRGRDDLVLDCAAGRDVFISEGLVTNMVVGSEIELFSRSLHVGGTTQLPGIAFQGAGNNPDTSGMSYGGAVLQFSENGQPMFHASQGAGAPFFRVDAIVTDVRFQGAAGFATTAEANMAIPDLANGLIRIATSSRRYKTDIQPAPELADLDLEPVSFHREDDDRNLVGFIAEDLADQDERLALYNDDGEVDNFADRGLMAIMAAKINRLEAQVAELLAAS